MKFLSVLPFAALAASIVIPDAEVMEQIAIERPQKQAENVYEQLPTNQELVDEIERTAHKAIDTSKSLFDQAVDIAIDVGTDISKKCHDKASSAKSWIESTAASVEDFEKHHGHHGHHGHHKPNETVYQLISKSKYTTKLAALINEYEDLVKTLNSTVANFTVFAPVDHAFEKVPEHAPKPSKEELEKILLYHISSDFYPAGRVLVTHTIPTLLGGEGIGGEAQRLSTNIGLKGLTVNFYSRIIAIDIFGTNGVIHGVDSILVPPPKAADVIDFLPGEFSTLELGLLKTGLFKPLNDTATHVGGTLFAPSNSAFERLGPKINAFLFSNFGEKYLKALLKYHIVPNKTLYSDAFYKSDGPKSVKQEGIPKGYFHVSF